jgi:hypothetical protein
VAPVAAPLNRSELALGTEEPALQRSGAHAYLFVKNKDVYEIRALPDLSARPVLVAHGARPTAVVPVGDQLAVLAMVDSNGDGEFSAADDETDLCFAAPGPDPLDFPARVFPKQLTTVAAKLAPLTTEGPLAGARLRFTSEQRIELSVAKAPAGELRELVKQTQDRVTQLSELPHLSVVIHARDTGQLAISDWDDDAGMFLVSAGIGDAQLLDRSQYQLEVNSKILYSSPSPQTSLVVEADCSGTVKNISDHALVDLEVECMNQILDRRRHAKARVAPARLAPGATGTFRVGLGLTDRSKGYRIVFSSGGKRIPQFAAHGLKRAEQLLAAATQVHETTQLAYAYMVSTLRPSPMSKLLKIYVRAPRALEDGPTAERESVAAKAVALLAPLGTKNVPDKGLEVTPVLIVLRGDGPLTAWSYANGKLIEGPPDI